MQSITSLTEDIPFLDLTGEKSNFKWKKERRITERMRKTNKLLTILLYFHKSNDFLQSTACLQSSLKDITISFLAESSLITSCEKV